MKIHLPSIIRSTQTSHIENNPSYNELSILQYHPNNPDNHKTISLNNKLHSSQKSENQPDQQPDYQSLNIKTQKNLNNPNHLDTQKTTRFNNAHNNQLANNPKHIILKNPKNNKTISLNNKLHSSQKSQNQPDQQSDYQSLNINTQKHPKNPNHLDFLGGGGSGYFSGKNDSVLRSVVYYSTKHWSFLTKKKPSTTP